MDLAVAQAAADLGIDQSRIRALLRSGDLRGRKVGRAWLVDSENVDLFAGRRAPGGRPLAPAKAWGALNILDRGDPSYLDAVARSRARAALIRLSGSSPNRWRAALRSRQCVLPCRAHPAALKRLLAEEGVVLAGPGQAAARGADVVVVAEVPEVYVRASAWQVLAPQLVVYEAVNDPNVIVRIPNGVWPLDGYRDANPGLAMLAADLLDSAEPRSVSAGVEVLNDLAEHVAPIRTRA